MQDGEEHSKADSAAPITSDLDDIINSSAHAVEGFGRDGAASPADTINSEEGTPREISKVLIVSLILQINKDV